ncbi:hypothetical protein OIU84_022305 [Salix udensis]|uniref:Uncharacterized protein n=1 Tax=Salix udensis TaxID=889485 RepID=A0AAD6PEL4_9ROSI|nr:hypothetical protein OIU84_022305 [Salix udensis]
MQKIASGSCKGLLPDSRMDGNVQIGSKTGQRQSSDFTEGFEKGKGVLRRRNEGVVPLRAQYSNGVDDMSPTSTTMWVSSLVLAIQLFSPPVAGSKSQMVDGQ